MSMNAWRLEEIVVGSYGKLRSLDTRFIMIRSKSWDGTVLDAVEPISGDFYDLWKSEGNFDGVLTELKYNGSRVILTREVTSEEAVIITDAKDKYKALIKSIRDRVELISSKEVLSVIKALDILNFIYEGV